MKVVQTILISCISRSQGQKIDFKNIISKILSGTRPGAFVFSVFHHLEILYQIYSNYAPEVIKAPLPPRCHKFTLNNKGKALNDLFS